MATKLQDGNTPCLAATPSEPRPTVLVFDSGVGGLSVYDEIRHLLPDLHYIYAFDNVAFPYGEKAKRLLLSEWWQLSPRCKNVIPLRWLWSLATLPVPFHFLHYAKSSTSRLLVSCRRLNLLHV